MIEDMALRKFAPKTESNYLRAVITMAGDNRTFRSRWYGAWI
jgi:hypothetical protein